VVGPNLEPGVHGRGEPQHVGLGRLPRLARRLAGLQIVETAPTSLGPDMVGSAFRSGGQLGHRSAW
jgi:hypothetical protein